jgi:hypothetical protein
MKIIINGEKYYTQKETRSFINVKGSLSTYRKRNVFDSIKHNGIFIYSEKQILSYIKNKNLKRVNKDKINIKLKKHNLEFSLISEINSIGNVGTFKCKKCNFTWTAIISNACRKQSKCPKCYKKDRSLNTNDIKNRLKNRPIELLDECSGSKKRHAWKCLTCHNTWRATINSVINTKTGCPHCPKRSPKSINAQLKPKNIELYGKYIKYAIDIKLKCQICNHIWQTSPVHCLVKGRNVRCPQCTYERIKQKALTKIKSKKITLLNKYKSVTSKSQFQCKTCKHKWITTINGLSGCPECSVLKNEKLTGIYLKEILNQPIAHNERYYYKKTKNKAKYYFKIDFATKIKNITYFIEYNGRQHYQPVRFNGMTKHNAAKKFKKQQLRDNKLRRYCKDNNIHLIEIDGRKYKEEKIKDYLISYFSNILSS